VAQKSLEVARADFARASQKAFSDPASKSELTVLKAVAEQRQAEVQYTAELLERIQVRAPADGVVAFSDASDWLGRPVRVGEKIMILADPQEVELVVWLPVDEAIALEPGAPIEAFLTTDPTRTFHATLRLASYTAEKSQEQVLSYRIRATFDEGTDSLPRIGLQATAKVYGERVTLFYYVFRRPIAVARRWLGL
jgi:multidrug resistance efflux pump